MLYYMHHFYIFYEYSCIFLGRKGLHGRAEVDVGLNPRGKKGLKKNDKQISADGGKITHRNYKNNERIQWTVKAGLSILLRRDESRIARLFHNNTTIRQKRYI